MINTATVETPLRDLGIAADEAKAAKAKQVLEQYGEMFGVDDPGAELGDAETVTDELTAPTSPRWPTGCLSTAPGSASTSHPTARP